jgi:hypothetical protein
MPSSDDNRRFPPCNTWQKTHKAACAISTVTQAYINGYNDGLMHWRDGPPAMQEVMGHIGC